MSTTSIVFRGLCTFVERQKTYEVYLLSGMQHVNCSGHAGHIPHLASLSIPIKAIDLKAGATTWLPDAVIYVGSGDAKIQVGVWKLTGEVSLVPTPAGPRGTPTWTDRAKAIDLSAHHAADGSSPRTRQDVLAQGAAIVELVGGDIRTDEPSTELRVKRKGGGEPDSNGPFAQAIVWTAAGEQTRFDIVSSKKKIAILAGAQVAVTNVAPVPAADGLCHFEHYYEVFTRKPVDDRLLVLEPEQSLTMDVPVFDCVPPTPGPGEP